MKQGSLGNTIRNALSPGTATARIVSIVFIPILAIMVLLLPPFSVLARISGAENSNQFMLGPGGGGGAVGGLTVQARPSVLDSDIKVVVQKETKDQKGQALPQGMSAVSPIYKLSVSKPVNVPVDVEVELSEAIPAKDNLDFLVREGDTWEWVAGATLSQDGLKAGATLRKAPTALVVARFAPQEPFVSGWVAANAKIDSVSRETLNVVNPQWHTVNEDGTVAGSSAELPSGKYQVYPSIQNLVDGAFKGEVVNRVLASDDSRQRHVSSIVALAKQKGYAGVDINYRGIDPVLRDKFTAFISELATALHQEKKYLSLSVPVPEKNARGWETGAYDWYSLGKAADSIAIAAEGDQSLYPSVMPQALAYAATQIDRRKLQLTVSTLSHEKSKGGVKDISLAEALALATKVDVKGSPSFMPGETVTFFATNLLKDTGASGIYWSNDTKTVTFSYPASDGPRTVWIENLFSVGYKLQYVKQFNLRGAGIQNLGESAVDKDIASLVQAFKTNGTVKLSEPAGQSFNIGWQSSDGSLAASGQSWTTWVIPNNPGAKYTISLVVGDGVSTTVGTKTLTVAIPPTPTPSPTPRPTSTPAPKPTESPATPTPVPAQAAAPTEVPPTATVVKVSSSGGTRYPGIGYGMQVDPGNDLPRALRLLKGAGFDWAKVQIRWNTVEPSKGNINWGYIDNIVNQMSANGVRVLFSVAVAPGWSTPSDYTDSGPPRDPQDFANFVGAIAARHPGKVHAYEIWNEQNVYHEWGGKGRRINAAKYIDLLKAGYDAIKRNDPDAVVVSGGLTPTGFNDGDTAYDDVVYMDMMYQAGLKDYSDAIGVHGNVVMPYGADLAAGEKGDHGSFYFRRFEELRAVMERYGDSGKQIWFTEFGWPSSSQGLSRFPRATEISEAQQSDWLVRAFALSKDRGYVGVMLLWNLNFAPGAEPADDWGKAAFSVLRRDWSPRPAYGALVSMPKN